jgi:hypothetical protein
MDETKKIQISTQAFLFLVVLVASTSPALLARVPAFAKDGGNPRQPIYVLLAAILVAVSVFVPLHRLLPSKTDPLSASILLGMVAVLPMTMQTSTDPPALPQIAIAVFLFYFFSSHTV